MHRKNKILTGIITLSLTIPYAYGNSILSGALPLNISADNGMKYDTTNQVFNASGNVIVKQDGITLSGDTVTISYANNRKLKTITAQKNVNITMPEQSLTGQNLQYDAIKNTIKICGNAKYISKQNKLQGDCIFFDINNRQTHITGKKKKRITAILQP